MDLKGTGSTASDLKGTGRQGLLLGGGLHTVMVQGTCALSSANCDASISGYVAIYEINIQQTRLCI